MSHLGRPLRLPAGGAARCRLAQHPQQQGQQLAAARRRCHARRRPCTTVAAASDPQQPQQEQPSQPQAQQEQQQQALPPHGPQDSAKVRARRRELEEELQAAVGEEDYAEAARLKRELDALLASDPLSVLANELQRAVEEERYQDAARLRDQLKELEEALAPPPSASASDTSSSTGSGGGGSGSGEDDDEELPCCSDTTTQGVRVQVESFYVPSQSFPDLKQYLFCYRVTITNTGSRVVQLRARHWRIRDFGARREDHVRGPGVIGQMPILAPGAKHSYESACPLRSPRGCMEGEYEMAVLDEASGGWGGQRFEARIGRFALDVRRQLEG